jgi:hypothetical protein
MMPEEFLQLSELSTFTGIILAVNLLLSFTKELFDRYVTKLPTKYLAFIYAEILMFGYAAAKGELNPEQGILIVLNGVVVALTAVGGYRVAAEPNGNFRQIGGGTLDG